MSFPTVSLCLTDLLLFSKAFRIIFWLIITDFKIHDACLSLFYTDVIDLAETNNWNVYCLKYHNFTYIPSVKIYTSRN